jgi:hypothetical protein
MISNSRVSLVAVVLLFAAPLASFACGGGEKPPETPADESAMDGGAAPATSGAPAAESAAPAAESAAPAESSAPAETAAASAAPAPPPPPPISETDCGKCIDKTCAKPAAACGKNTDCQAMVDAFHGCGSDKGASACLGQTTPPTAAKPKKLAAAYSACVKKAVAKACKAKCQ